MTLRIPIIDVKHRPYCGPTAAAALTGVPLSRIEAMLRRRRKGFKDSLGRKRPIKGTYTWEIVGVLKRLGCKVTELRDPESTLGRFGQDTAHIRAAYLVEVTGHFMATYMGQFCDTSSLVRPSPIEGYHRAARRVRRAWRVEAPAEPKFGQAPGAPRAAAPKLSVTEVRAARVAAAIKRWTAKKKRAETALRKLKRQESYYAKRSAGDTGIPRPSHSGSPDEARPSAG